MLRPNPDEKLKQDSINLNSTLSSPKTIKEVPTKNCIDNLCQDPSIIKNTYHVDFNAKNLDKVGWVKVNRMPAVEEHMTSKLYVDNAIHEIIGYVNNLQEINRNRRDLSSVFDDQDNEFDNNNINNLDSITTNRDPNLDNELSSKNYVVDSLGEGTLLRLNQTLENYLKVSAGKDTYSLTKYNKIQVIYTTESKCPIIGSDLVQKWNIRCNKKNNQSRITDFIKSTKTYSRTGSSGATSLPPIGNSFIYIETNSNEHGHDRVFVSWKKTDIIQKSNITFYYIRFSILNKNSEKSISRFRISLLLEDNSWSTRYNIP